MHVEAGVAVEPCGDRGMLMRGVIVSNDADVENRAEFRRKRSLNPLRAGFDSHWNLTAQAHGMSSARWLLGQL